LVVYFLSTELCLQRCTGKERNKLGFKKSGIHSWAGVFFTKFLQVQTSMFKVIALPNFA